MSGVDVIFDKTYVSDADGVFTRYIRPKTEGKFVLEAASCLPHATLAVDGTNYVELVLKQGSTAITKLKTTNSGQAADSTHEANAALTAGAETSFTLTGVGGQLEFSSTVPLVLVGTKGGSGGAVEVDINIRARAMRSTS